MEEPTPSHVRYARRHVAQLWLRLPTGRLVLTGRAAVLEGTPRAQSFRHELDLPPGEYAVEAWAFVPHEERLEAAGALPGDPAPPRLAGVIPVLGVFTGLVTLLGVIALTAHVLLGDRRVMGLSALAVLGAWLLFAVVSRLTGWSRYRALQRENLRRTLASLPPLPDFTLSLWRVEEPPARGGGLSSAESASPPG